MAAPWTIKIYGADTNVTGDMPNLATVEAISGVASMTLTVGWMHPKPNFEDSGIEYLDGSKNSAYRIRIGYTPELEAKYFPTTATGIETFYNTSVLKKK